MKKYDNNILNKNIDDIVVWVEKVNNSNLIWKGREYFLGSYQNLEFVGNSSSSNPGESIPNSNTLCKYIQINDIPKVGVKLNNTIYISLKLSDIYGYDDLMERINGIENNNHGSDSDIKFDNSIIKVNGKYTINDIPISKIINLQTTIDLLSSNLNDKIEKTYVDDLFEKSIEDPDKSVLSFNKILYKDAFGNYSWKEESNIEFDNSIIQINGIYTLNDIPISKVTNLNNELYILNDKISSKIDKTEINDLIDLKIDEKLESNSFNEQLINEKIKNKADISYVDSKKTNILQLVKPHDGIHLLIKNGGVNGNESNANVLIDTKISSNDRKKVLVFSNEGYENRWITFPDEGLVSVFDNTLVAVDMSGVETPTTLYYAWYNEIGDLNDMKSQKFPASFAQDISNNININENEFYINHSDKLSLLDIPISKVTNLEYKLSTIDSNLKKLANVDYVNETIDAALEDKIKDPDKTNNSYDKILYKNSVGQYEWKTENSGGETNIEFDNTITRLENGKYSVNKIPISKVDKLNDSFDKLEVKINEKVNESEISQQLNEKITDPNVSETSYDKFLYKNSNGNYEWKTSSEILKDLEIKDCNLVKNNDGLWDMSNI